MAEYTIDKIEYGGNTYNFDIPKIHIDSDAYSIVGFNKTTIDGISGVAITYDNGIDSSIFLPDGAGFNTGSQAIISQIPTKTSDLTNDSGFITASHTSTYSLPTAVYNTLGGIKPAYSTTGTATLTTSSQAYTNSPTIAARTTTSGKYYGVEIDSAGRLFVNVPWTDTNTKVTVNELTSSTTYYPILAAGTGTATRQIDSTLNGLTYKSIAGTTSAVGSAILILGNNIARAATNNEKGCLRMYGELTYYTTLKASVSGSNKEIFLPNKSGTLAITDDITDKKLQVETLASGTLYYPILATGTGTAIRQIDSTLEGLRYESIAGTTSTAGSASLVLGNHIAEGTANNEDGQLVLYGPSGKYGMIVCNSTANRIVELPDQTGTLATTKDIYESVELTQLEYDALSTTDKIDPKKVYFVKDADPSETSELLDMFYPVGTIYETQDLDFDPQFEWGGSWTMQEISSNVVVDEGTSGNWTYRKWLDGTAECWETVSLASGSFTATGNIYYRSASGYAFPSGLFNATPIVNVTADMGNVGSAMAVNVTASSFAMYVLSAVSTARGVTLYVHASGKWKTLTSLPKYARWRRVS